MDKKNSIDIHHDSLVCIENRRLKEVLRDAIRTIEDTKRSFKSKRLETLKYVMLDAVLGPYDKK